MVRWGTFLRSYHLTWNDLGVTLCMTLWCSTCTVCASMGCMQRCGALVAHRCTYVPSSCRTSQYHRTFISFSVSLWNDHADPGAGGFQEQGQSFLLAYAAGSLFVFYCFHIIFFLSIGWYCGAGVIGPIGRLKAIDRVS